MATDPNDTSMQDILAAAGALPATSGMAAPATAPPVPPTLTNTPTPVPPLAGPLAPKTPGEESLGSNLGIGPTAPGSATGLGATQQPTPKTIQDMINPMSAPSPAPTGAGLPAARTGAEAIPPPLTSTVPNANAPTSPFPATAAAADEQPLSMLGKIKQGAESAGRGVMGATGLTAFEPGSGATPEQKGQAIMNLIGKIGQVGSAATGSPQQKEQAIQRQGQQNQLLQMQNEAAYHRELATNNANKTAETIKKDADLAEAKHQDQVRKNLMLNQVEDPQTPGVFHPANADQTLANPLMAHNSAAWTAATNLKDADAKLAAAKTNVANNQNPQFIAALQQRRDQAAATLAMANAHLHLGEEGLENTVSNQQNSRNDRSFQFNQGQLDKLRAPIDQRAQRMTTLTDSLNQGTPQADALIAPELLTAAAGGAGSGLRMNEAEISRIVGGRTVWETLKAKAQAYELDPSKGFALTPAQRTQVRSLVNVMSQRLDAKRQIMDSATNALADPDSTVEDHRRILADSHAQLDKIDSLTDSAVPQQAAAAPKKNAAPATTNAGVAPGSPEHQQYLNSITFQGQHPVDAANGAGGTIVKMKKDGPWISVATGKPL